ncbi:Uncharacterized membrane protein YebE, DUF533 family [Tranquillimonas alkanivorans]|uniref:Uncharacterized membrane protein YebE, DUF533 family n=2 Tax=Tranquillimonas alkanivorans TaxID=441119 RepID=A0A1I5WS53_9RHOB|nr:Uncharacterized membrane protein YebE, DUF533 family [Tranquillimonas alkanivorans]
MSLKRILGTMLASRMAGRGRRGGLGAGAAMSGLGYPRRRSRMGGKLGMAALGYMAYRAYQDHQSRTTGTSGNSTAGASGSGLGDMIRNVADQLAGKGSGGSGTDTATASDASPDMAEDARAAEALSDDTALLLIRAMVTAAYSDGSLSQEERKRIMEEISEAGADAEDRAVMEREIANPKPLEELLAQVHDEETAEEFYLASRAAIDPDTEPHRAYLADLRTRLKLSDDSIADVENMMS